MKWILYLLLALIWGSSFWLMLLGLEELNPWQVAAIRLLSAGLVMLPFTWRSWRRVPRNQVGYIILSGLLGSFFPAFLFCLAETRLDSSFAGTLNSLTPIFVLIVGVLFFQLRVRRQQAAGILIGFAGSIFLFLAKSGQTGDLLYVGFVVLATFFYGLNVNMVGRRLKDIPSFEIAVLAFSFLTIPSGLILLLTDVQNLDGTSLAVWKSVGASALLGIAGTSLASVLFYKLLKTAGGIFASTVTYGIPFVAMFWGWLNHERITPAVVGSLLLILLGIFITNASKKPVSWLTGWFIKKEGADTP